MDSVDTVLREPLVGSANGRAWLTGKRLVVPVSIQPGEGFADLILRATAANGFRRLTQIAVLMGEKRMQVDFSPFNLIDCRYPPDTIAHVLGLPGGAEQVSGLLYTSDRGKVDFFGAFIGSGQFCTCRRVSPLSLRKSPYQKAIWGLKNITFDPSTREILLDHCPVCCIKLSCRETLGIPYCHSCSVAESLEPAVDLREFPQGKVLVSDDEALDLVVALVDPEDSSRRLLKCLHDELTRFSRGEIFEFITRLARLLDHSEHPGRIHDFREEVSPVSLSVAARAIIDWPNGLYELGTLLEDKCIGVRRSASQTWHGINQALDRHNFSEPLRSLVSGRLKGSGIDIRTMEEKSDKDYSPGRIKSSLIHLRRLERSPKVTEDSKKLGLPSRELHDVYKSGFVKCRDLDFDYGGMLENFHTVKELSSLCKERIDAKALYLIDILYATNLNFHSWPKVLEYIVSHRTTLFLCGRVNSPLIYRLATRDFKLWAEMLRQCSRVEDAIDSVDINRATSAFYLNLKVHQAVLAVKFGLLDHRRPTARAMLDFRKKYIFRREIDVRVALRGGYCWGKCDKIKPVTGWPEARDRALVESYLDAEYDD